MDDCDAILAGGIFDRVEEKRNLTLSEALTQWLKETSFQELKTKIDAGMKISLPIEGVPVNVDGNFTEEQFNQWKREVNTGSTQTLNQVESEHIIRSVANKDILRNWEKCMKDRKRLVVDIEGEEHPPYCAFTARYFPNAVGDKPAVVAPNGFSVVGATPISPLLEGQKIPYSGVSVHLRREATNVRVGIKEEIRGNSKVEVVTTELHPPVQVVLNTDKGSEIVDVGAITRATDGTVTPIPAPNKPPVPAEVSVRIGNRMKGRKGELRVFTHTFQIPPGWIINRDYVGTTNVTPKLPPGYSLILEPHPGSLLGTVFGLSVVESGSTIQLHVTLQCLGGHGIFPAHGDERYQGNFVMHCLRPG